MSRLFCEQRVVVGIISISGSQLFSSCHFWDFPPPHHPLRSLHAIDTIILGSLHISKQAFLRCLRDTNCLFLWPETSVLPTTQALTPAEHPFSRLLALVKAKFTHSLIFSTQVRLPSTKIGHTNIASNPNPTPIQIITPPTMHFESALCTDYFFYKVTSIRSPIMSPGTAFMTRREA